MNLSVRRGFFLAVLTLGLLGHDAVVNARQDRQLPPWIEDAIKFGSTKKARPYRLERKVLGMAAATFGEFTTPYLRVAVAATEAREKLAPFNAASVTDEMLADGLVVRVFPLIGQKMNDTHRSARHIVIRRPNSKDPNDAIQPVSLEPFAEVASNLLGASIEKQGLVATFPMSALKEGLAFYLMYENAPLTKDNFEFKITRDMVQQAVK